MLPPNPEPTMPQVRHRTKSDRTKNGGLQSILSPTAKAIEVLSVEKLEYQVYNTKAVVVVEDNNVVEERVLIYNRVDIRSVLSQYGGPERTLQSILKDMNDDGYDVTEDDIEYDEPNISVKPTSLGYYEGDIDAGSCSVKHYFKVTLLGDDKNQAWFDVRSAMQSSFVNLTAPAQPNLQFLLIPEHISVNGVYQYTIVSVGILDYSSSTAGQDMSAQFNLPRIGDTSDEWFEILPNGPINNLNPDFSIITTFGPSDPHTIVRCIVTEYSAA